jgi:patatin-related protein
MREIGEHLRDEVERMIEAMLGKTWFLSRPNPARIGKWRMMMLEKSADASGYAYPAYAHLRLAGLLDDMVATARRSWPEGSSEHFRALRKALWREYCARGLDRVTGDKGKVIASPTITFFREQDIRYRVRRLRFLARRLSEEVEGARDVGAEVADRMRDAIYTSLSAYLERETAEYLGADLADAVRDGVRAPGRLIDLLATRRDLSEADNATDTALHDGLQGLPDEARRVMLFGYLGYTLYDIATLPLLQGEGLDEFDPIKVDRISPDDATTIRKGGAAATLKGIEFNNFGAFFSRTYRENDYLWGRLHGVDRLVDIVISALPDASVMDAGAALAFKKRAFLAILDAEAPRLKRIKPLIAELQDEVGRL